MRISVLTASLPEREAFRAEAIASVNAQTFAPIAHLIGIDHERVGPAAILNRLLPAAVAMSAEWVALLADDDVLYPQHLEALSACESGDIRYSYCDVEGRGGWSPNAPFDPDRLRRENYIPATTLIRTELAVTLGWNVDAANGWEDYDFWLRALDVGAEFACVPEVTWLYRFHGSNHSTRGR